VVEVEAEGLTVANRSRPLQIQRRRRRLRLRQTIGVGSWLRHMKWRGVRARRWREISGKRTKRKGLFLEGRTAGAVAVEE
jgi:hypothetical protein